MSAFADPLAVEILDAERDGRVTARLLQGFGYRASGGEDIAVPAGFVTDFASVPRLPLIYLAYANKAHLAALVHDHLYAEGGTEIDREFADSVFLQGMLDTLVPEEDNSLTAEDANTMYRAVRQFGASHFNFHQGVSPS